MWPVGRVWRSPPASPLRAWTGDTSTALAENGQALVTRSRHDAEAAGRLLLRRLGDRLVRSQLTDEMATRLLTSGAVDRIAGVVVNHPATEALVANALDDPGLSPLIARALDSRLVDELVTQLLASDEMRLVLEYVRQSPELRAAPGQQTAGLAADMADSVRSRTVVADAAAERVAHSLIRRRRRKEPGE